MMTFTAMRSSFPAAAKTLIIGVALFALTACSLVRVSYDNGPGLVSWWLDGYLHLDDAQKDAARPLLRDWFAWHRSTELPVYARQLAQWKVRAAGEVSADELCAWSELVRERMNLALDRAVPAAARLLPSITPPQWAQLEKALAEKLADERKKRAQPAIAERRAAALERAIDNAEQYYGSLTAAQRQLLVEAVANSPMDAGRWLDDREKRQRRFVAALRRAQQEADAGRRQAAVAQAFQLLLQPADADAAALQARWQQHGCSTSAKLHATTTPAQRRHLQERLGSWEEDLRALAAAGAS